MSINNLETNIENFEGIKVSDYKLDTENLCKVEKVKDGDWIDVSKVNLAF